jgi:hypothetical protein
MECREITDPWLKQVDDERRECPACHQRGLRVEQSQVEPRCGLLRCPTCGWSGAIVPPDLEDVLRARQENHESKMRYIKGLQQRIAAEGLPGNVVYVNFRSRNR